MRKFKKFNEDTVDAVCEECDIYADLVVEASEYEGRKVTLNDPFRMPTGSKRKFGVYVKNERET